jgi:hypothetical protein
MPASVGRWSVIGALWLTVASLADAESIPLKVEQGHCEFVLSTPHESDQFYLIVGSLAAAARDTPIRVSTQATTGPEHLPLDQNMPSPAWRNRIEAQALLLEKQRRQRPALDRFPPLATPPSSKTFHVFTGERDLDNPAFYEAVHADLHTVGRRVQVYVDRSDRAQPDVAKTIAEVVRLFDDDIGRAAEQRLGQVVDVDRDGRFTILLTRKLGALQKGKVAVDGFVRGSDFFRELPAPFSNQCDMLYLNAALKPGPHLRTVMAHEYTHAVTFCEHALADYHDGPTNQDEESWLSEGLAHLVEDPQTFGWSNLDQRVNVFLSSPERFPLVVPDYFSTGLWRNPGMRGAGFLFLRSVQARAGDDLTRHLIQSPLRGVANLETATRRPFAELFRQACADLLDEKNYGYLAGDGHSPLLCGPRFHDVSLADGGAATTVAGTAVAFFLLHSPGGTHARVHVDSDGPVQMTLVRIPADLPRLSLRWVDVNGGPGVQVTAHHGAVRLRGIAWDDASGPRRQSMNLKDFFERDRLAAGTSIVSGAGRAILRDGSSGTLCKVLGEDAQGRPVAAWLSTKGE